MKPNDPNIEDFIREAFSENYERLRLETGSSVTPDVKEAALQQVLFYYKKMRDVAETVTETEIHLTLPEQQSPQGRRYTLEGVVDIVREHNKTTMYDVKTHFDADKAQGELMQYSKQLNVYAHIWQNLRGNPLDETAIIATKPTREVRAALKSGNQNKLKEALNTWQPCIHIPLEQSSVQTVIEDFGAVVDKIENREFTPPPVSVLKNPIKPGARVSFGAAVCVNCDVRFSCNSYRQYAIQTQGGQSADRVINQYLNDYGAEYEKSEWLDANMTTLDRNKLEENKPEGSG
jgi:G:T/U-mismatch repair DNA glycosylase